jgi:hypothetical protein
MESSMIGTDYRLKLRSFATFQVQAGSETWRQATMRQSRS